MACENMSKYYPIDMKFSGYHLLYEDRALLILDPIAVNPFSGTRAERLRKCVYIGQNLTGCYSYVLCNKLMLAVPKMV